MRWKKSLILFTLFATLAVLLCLSFPSYAQDYRFSLDQEYVEVWINWDGSVTLEYWFTFTCDPGAHPIDVVDVGLPTRDYRVSDVRGDVGGQPISYAEESEYVDGVAVWLGNGTIQPGRTGTVHVIVDRVGGMLYEDDTDVEYASTNFSPTWFGSEFVHGSTDLTVRFHLPEGVQPEEPRWHASPSGWPYDEPHTDLDDDGRVLYTWRHTEAKPDRQYIFGASFPRQYVDEAAIQKGPSALEQMFATITGALSCCCNPANLFFIIFGGVMALSVWSNRRRKMQYLPPLMKVEGVGIKRGLTAVEAAILLETPLNKVLTMILFGLLKKGAVTVLDDNPLKIEVNEPLPGDLRPYENKFIKAVKKNHTLSEKGLRSMMTALIKAVNSKMKGFSRKESVAYYRDIVKRAWQQVEGADTPEVRSKRFDEGLEWAMLDKDFDGRTRRVFHTGPVYMPMWWGHYRPWASATASAGSVPKGTRAPSTSTSSTPRLPTLPGAAFAASIVRGVENTSGRIVRSVTDFTGGVTKVTNPLPKTSSSGRRSSGGGSSCACACACACAGCACACAGGGR
jgi:hypothetical protein